MVSSRKKRCQGCSKTIDMLEVQEQELLPSGGKVEASGIKDSKFARQNTVHVKDRWKKLRNRDIVLQ